MVVVILKQNWIERRKVEQQCQVQKTLSLQFGFSREYKMPQQNVNIYNSDAYQEVACMVPQFATRVLVSCTNFNQNVIMETRR